jgi:hypothetical protein
MYVGGVLAFQIKSNKNDMEKIGICREEPHRIRWTALMRLIWRDEPRHPCFWLSDEDNGPRKCGTGRGG